MDYVAKASSLLVKLVIFLFRYFDLRSWLLLGSSQIGFFSPYFRSVVVQVRFFTSGTTKCFCRSYFPINFFLRSSLRAILVHARVSTWTACRVGGTCWAVLLYHGLVSFLHSSCSFSGNFSVCKEEKKWSAGPPGPLGVEILSIVAESETRKERPQ